MRTNNHLRQLSVLVCAAAVGLLANGGAAGAPANNPHLAAITLHCAGGTTPGIVTLVRGEFTPVHVSDSHAVFVPVAFGEFVGSATDADGNALFTVDEPPLSKGSAVPPNRKLEDCTGVIELDVPGGHFSGSSTVTGFFASGAASSPA
jgi:hypothetical protein